jgi:putative aldouronate transport system substrate-binding protein
LAVISAKTKYPEAAVRWLNYSYSPVGADLFNWGVEGISYNVVNGKKVYTDDVLYNPRFSTEESNYIYKIHFAPKWMEFGVVCNPNLLRTPASLAARMLWGDDPNVDTTLSLPPYSLNMAEQSTRSRLLNDINTYVDEMTLKFITGAEPLSRWDAYVQTVNRMGLPDLLQSEQSAYDRYLTKK